MGLVLLIGLGACGGSDVPSGPARPVLGVAVPLSGAGADVGKAAVQAVELAVGAAFEVVPFDDGRPDVAAAVAARPDVLAAVAHIGRAAAEKQAATWLAVDVPVVVAAPGEFTDVPRVVPPLEDSVRCAAPLLADADFWVRTDGSTAAGKAGQALGDTLPEHYLGMEAVDPGGLSRATTGLTGRRARTVVWTGDAAAGGNLLRVLRSVKMDAPFVALGAYDPRFLAAAGAAAEGALVTIDGRPTLDRALVDAWSAKYGAAPLPGEAVAAYDAAALLLAAWQSAGPAADRDAVRRALASVVATGASGPMYLDERGVVRPVVCATFRVTDGGFVQERLATEADGMSEESVPEKHRKPGRKTFRPPPMPER